MVLICEALEIHGLEAGADLEAFDPFTCALWFEALAGCSTMDVRSCGLWPSWRAARWNSPTSSKGPFVGSRRRLARSSGPASCRSVTPEGLRAGSRPPQIVVAANVLRRLGRGGRMPPGSPRCLARESAG